MGLDPETLGSHSGPKAGAKPLSYPGIPYFLKILFIFHERGEREREAEEKQAPCREPNVGLDPRTLGSQPEPKADAQPLSHPGVPVF